MMDNKFSLSLISKAPEFKSKNSFESVHLLSTPSSSDVQARADGDCFSRP